MARPTIFVNYEGKKITITELARKFGLSPMTVNHRWRKGKRTIEDLTAPPHYTSAQLRPDELTTSQIEWLREVAFASEGQKDHWKIMCELAGVNKKYAKQMERIMNDYQRQNNPRPTP